MVRGQHEGFGRSELVLRVVPRVGTRPIIGMTLLVVEHLADAARVEAGMFECAWEADHVWKVVAHVPLKIPDLG